MKDTQLIDSSEPASNQPEPAKLAHPHIILLVDDHSVVTSGMAALINYEGDLEVCGTADDEVAAIKQIEALQPELVVLDITLKGRGGLELLKEIKTRFPKQKVLVLSMHDELLYASRALRAGASGYLMKEEALNTLLVAIRQVLQGDIYLSARMEKKVLGQFLQPGEIEESPLSCLSDRELEIFRMIGQGKTTREIADSVFLSVKTIESHRAHIKLKLGLSSGRDLVKEAIRYEQEAGLRIGTEPAAAVEPSVQPVA
jgi:DNA-binding NarL/FixJ family response regulator